MYRKLSLSCRIGLLLCLYSLAAVGDGIDGRILEQNGEILKLRQVIEIINESSPGRVLEVELSQENERYIYEIEILDHNGVIWEHKIDAKSGDLLKREKE